MNISCFVYRDINRNGSYDMPDRPFAGLPVAMQRPRAKEVVRFSNISGFTNFEMYLHNRKYDVYKVGQHTIRAMPPPGFRITSGNASQTISFKKVKDSPAGMAIEKTMVPVGIAPKLTISGSVEPRDTAGKNPIEFIIATPADGSRITVPVSDSGEYSFPAVKGDWKLEFVDREAKSFTREVSVGDYPLLVSRIDPTENVSPAKPDLRRVGFDDLTISDTLYEVPNGYGDLHWTNWIATHHKFYSGAGYINATVSSEFIAYNSSGHPGDIWSEEGFDFAGVHLAVAWNNAEPHDVVIRAWRGDEMVYEDRVRGAVSGPFYFDADYQNITRLEFSHEACWQIILDDFEYRID